MKECDPISNLAIEYLFKSRADLLTGIAYSFVHDRSVAEDIVGDAFLSLLEHRESVSPEKIDDYLFIIVRNKCLSYRRDQSAHKDILERIRRRELGMMDYYTAAIAQAGFPKVNAAEIQSIYREELRKMAPLEREVFLASRREGLSRREIAESFGISENTVRYLLSKVLSALRVALSDYLDTP